MNRGLIAAVAVLALGGRCAYLVARGCLRRTGQVVDRLIEAEPVRYARGVAVVHVNEGGEQR